MRQKKWRIAYFKDPASRKEPAKDWLTALRDKAGKAKIMVQIYRAENGNFGHFRSLGDGVSEMRINFGPGYRVYYALEGNDLILLLLAGDKSSQEKDIRIAKSYWRSYKKDS